MFDFIGKYRRILSILIIVGLAVVDVLIVKRTSNYENAYYIVQIVMSCVVACGVVIAALQYYVTSRANRIEKAIEMAEYYKENVLSLFSVVCFVFSQTGILEELQSVNNQKLVHFDIEEAKELFKLEQLKKIEELMHSEKLIESIVKADNLYHIGLAKEEILIEGGKKIQYNPDEIYRTFWGDYMEKLMNNLEYFSMYFMHNISDETVVFPSLNQTYISIVEMLYYHISKTNKLEEPKYYTNVIALYKKWKTRNQETKEKNINAQRGVGSRSRVL